MANVFLYILVSSVMCSVCGLAVLLLNRLVKSVSQRFKCSILMLAVILPYVGVFTVPFFPAPASERIVLPAVSGYTAPAVTDYVPEAAAETPPAAETPAPSVSTADIAGIAAWVWLAVTAGMLLFSIIRHIRLAIMLRGARQLIGNTSRLRICMVNIKISPFLTGFFRPAIYIPADTYSDEELELVIAHETAHYRRGDLYRRLLITMLNCMNWFNPVYRFVLKKLMQQIEYACDEAVTNELGEGSDKIYGYMLLKTAENGVNKEYLSVGLGSDAGNLKRRIEIFMNKDKKLSRNARALTLGAFAIFAVLCVGGCGAAMNAISLPQEEPEFDGIWVSSYFNDRSEVPQTLFTGKYYLTEGDPDSYIAVNIDGTLEIHCDEYFGYLEQYETADRFGEEEAQFAAGRREFLKSGPEYYYDWILGTICLKDPDDPDRERIYNRWFAVHTTEYDILIECYDKNFYFHKPVYEENENGQTIGFIPDDVSVDEFPDLIPVVGDNGNAGYIYAEEFHETPSSPEEAVKIHEAMENGTYEPKVFNVYEADGKTVIDTFTERMNTMEQVTLNDDGTYSVIG